MSFLPDDEDFDKRWLHETTKEQNMATVADLNAVREFAYKSFDHLDQDKNGFIESAELESLLQGNSLSNREKSFVWFLLTNQEQIACMAEQGDEADCAGISRQDIEQYFKLLADLI